MHSACTTTVSCIHQLPFTNYHSTCKPSSSTCFSNFFPVLIIKSHCILTVQAALALQAHKHQLLPKHLWVLWSINTHSLGMNIVLFTTHQQQTQAHDCCIVILVENFRIGIIAPGVSNLTYLNLCNWFVWFFRTGYASAFWLHSLTQNIRLGVLTRNFLRRVKIRLICFQEITLQPFIHQLLHCNSTDYTGMAVGPVQH